MTFLAPFSSPVPTSPKGWIRGLARQRSLGGTKRKVIRIKEMT